MASSALKSRRHFTGVAIFVLLISVFTSPVSAYPPGQTLALSVSSYQVLPGSVVTLRVTNAKPGKLTLIFGSLVKRPIVSNSFSTLNLRVTARTAGIYLTSAFANDGEKAWTRVYVPSATASKTAKVGTWGRVTVRYAKPGSVVVVRIDGRNFTRVVGSDSSAVVPFKVTRKGTRLLTATVGSVTLATLKTTGL